MQDNQVIEQYGKIKEWAPTLWGTNWNYFGIADHIVITLYPSPCWNYKASIITIYYPWD